MPHCLRTSDQETGCAPTAQRTTTPASRVASSAKHRNPTTQKKTRSGWVEDFRLTLGSEIGCAKSATDTTMLARLSATSAAPRSQLMKQLPMHLVALTKSLPLTAMLTAQNKLPPPPLMPKDRLATRMLMPMVQPLPPTAPTPKRLQKQQMEQKIPLQTLLALLLMLLRALPRSRKQASGARKKGERLRVSRRKTPAKSCASKICLQSMK
mmetsp:Transcript_18676/g.33420  ORF Transcript_18676/g.33420 Transcript_18676/m.33420 type:complete len:210 (+) Transcript_18676:376-1005(+)